MVDFENILLLDYPPNSCAGFIESTKKLMACSCQHVPTFPNRVEAIYPGGGYPSLAWAEAQIPCEPLRMDLLVGQAVLQQQQPLQPGLSTPSAEDTRGWRGPLEQGA